MHKVLKRFQKTCYPPRPGDSYTRQVPMIPGEGIGHEICSALIDVMDHIQAPVEFQVINNLDVDDEEAIKHISSHKAAVKGTLKHSPEHFQDFPNLAFRKKLDLFANVVQAFSLPGIKTRHQDIDLIIVRENLEGEYTGLEHKVCKGTVQSIKVTTYQQSKRIASYAFELAFLNNRKKVTAVHKANIMKKVDGEFLKAAREVAELYPSIVYDEMIIDNASMQMTLNPWKFDVLLLPNLYGSIMANIATCLVGGHGVVPGVNVSSEFAVFETGTRHTGKDIAGKHTANPTGLLLAGAMMLRHLNLPFFADLVQEGVFYTVNHSKVKTPDIGGTASTYEFTQEVMKNLL